jgi:hypothetical protein
MFVSSTLAIIVTVNASVNGSSASSVDGCVLVAQWLNTRLISHNPEIDGLNPATVTRREQMWKKMCARLKRSSLLQSKLTMTPTISFIIRDLHVN